VSNLSEDATESDLRDLFRRFGHTSGVFLVKDRQTFKSRGFAFVTFTERQDAQAALDKLNGHGYDNLIMAVEWAKPRAEGAPRGHGRGGYRRNGHGGGGGGAGRGTCVGYGGSAGSNGGGRYRKPLQLIPRTVRPSKIQTPEKSPRAHRRDFPAEKVKDKLPYRLSLLSGVDFQKRVRC
jgi:translation initiation factor 3 subunit G